MAKTSGAPTEAAKASSTSVSIFLFLGLQHIKLLNKRPVGALVCCLRQTDQGTHAPLCRIFLGYVFTRLSSRLRFYDGCKHPSAAELGIHFVEYVLAKGCVSAMAKTSGIPRQTDLPTIVILIHKEAQCQNRVF